MIICLRDHTFIQHIENFEIASFNNNELTKGYTYLKQSS